jgi:LPS export ABC transporter protein LptC
VRRAAALLAGVALLGFACARSTAPAASPPPPIASAVPTTPAYIIRGESVRGRPVTISNIVHGKAEYRLFASSVIYSTSLQRGTFKDNTLLFYKGRQVRLTVTAPTATVDLANHDVMLTGGVLARTPTGDTLRADSMKYNAVTQLVTGDGHIIVEDAAGNKLTGNHAIADLDLQQIRLFGDISAKGGQH